MDKAAGMWLNVFELCIGLSFIGLVFAHLLNCKLAGCVLAGLAIIGVTFGAVLFGAVGVIHSLERCEARHIMDGRDEVIVGLRLGPFSYSRALPLAKETN